MCGIAGFWNRAAGPVDATAMADALTDRGPDDGGAWAASAAGITLLHRRLAIFYLSPAGHQPMASPDERYVIVFNGEIYNHLDFRRELEAPVRATMLTDAIRDFSGDSVGSGTRERSVSDECDHG